MFPLADLDALRTISHRAQMAYALSCIEAAVRAYDLRGGKYEEWLERAWRRTSAPKTAWRDAPWPRNFAEIDELLDPPVGGWGAGVSDVLRKLFELAGNACEDILEGRGGAEPVRALATELSRNGIEAPPIAPFLRSPSTEMAGLGRSVPPSFFRDGIEREDFAADLHRSLRSDSAVRRRESASAIANLAIGSEALATALGTALFDVDREVCLLAETALQAIVSSAEFSEILRQTKRRELLRRARTALASARTKERLEGIAQVKELMDLDPSLLDLILGLARNDSNSRVRCAAIESLPLGILHFPRSKQLSGLGELVELLGDESADVRRTTARVLPWLLSPQEEKYGVIARAALRHLGDPEFLASVTLLLETAVGGVDLKALCSFLIGSKGPEHEMLLALLTTSPKSRDKVIASLSLEPSSASATRAAEVVRRLRAPEIRWCCTAFEKCWGTPDDDVGFHIVGTAGDGGPDFYLIARAVQGTKESRMAELLAGSGIQVHASQRSEISNCPWCRTNLAAHYGVQPLPLRPRE